MKHAHRLVISALLLSGILSALVLFRLLSEERFLRGADAYYYALQANYWAKTGRVKIPDSSPVHRLTGTLQKSGLSSETAVRGYQVASLLLFFLAALGLATRLGKAISLPAALLLLYLNLSPSLLFTALEFPKFFSFMILLPLWFYPLVMKNPKPWLSVVLALGTCALHRGALPLALGFSAALGLMQFRTGFFQNRSRWLLAAGLISGLAVLYFWGMHDRFHLLDLRRLTWKNPQLGIFALLGRQNLPETLRWEIPASCLLFLVLGVFFWKHHPERRRQLFLPLFLLLPGLFPWGAEEVFGVGERYAILIPILLALCALYLFSEPGAARPWYRWEKVCCAVLALTLPLLQGWRLALAHPSKIDPDFASYDQVTEELKGYSIPMLIAHKGIVFYYKFKRMREAFPYEPEDHWDKTRVWRLLYRIEPEELNAFLPDSCGLNSGLWKPLTAEHYTLLREDCWEAMRAGLRREDDADLYQRARETWLNPASKRPAFLYSKHGEEEPSEFPALAPGK